MLTFHPLLVPWSRKGRAIPLHSLWAVQPVQSLSACTRVHFTFYDYECTLLMPLTNILGVCLPSELQHYILKEGGHIMLILLLPILGRRYE